MPACSLTRSAKADVVLGARRGVGASGQYDLLLGSALRKGGRTPPISDFPRFEAGLSRPCLRFPSRPWGRPRGPVPLRACERVALQPPRSPAACARRASWPPAAGLHVALLHLAATLGLHGLALVLDLGLVVAGGLSFDPLRRRRRRLGGRLHLAAGGPALADALLDARVGVAADRRTLVAVGFPRSSFSAEVGVGRDAVQPDRRRR